MQQVSDHPTEDVFGEEVRSGDVYYVFGNDVVNATNLQQYLIENQQVECYRAEP